MAEEGQRHKARQLMCHPMTVCVEQTLLKRQGGEDRPSGPVEVEGTVPGDLVLCSTLPGKANDIMPVLPPPHPTPERLGEIGQTPAGEQEALGIDNGRQPEGFQAQAAVAGHAIGGGSGTE